MSHQLETYEWDNVWWEQTENTEAKRVLYIGDSISCGIRHLATKLSENAMLFDGFGTSKAPDNPWFVDSLRLCLNQQTKRDAVLFNNGLHGFHMSTSEYELGCRNLLLFLKEQVNEPIIVVLSTNVRNDPESQKIVDERNAALLRITEDLKLPVIDLASKALEYDDLHLADNIHFCEEGYTRLAEYLVESLKSVLKEEK